MRIAQFFACLAALAVLQISPSLGQELAPQEDGEAVAVEVATPPFEPIEGQARIHWQHEFDSWPGSRSLRLHFATVVVPAGTAVELVIQDRSGEIVDSYKGEELAALAGQWSLLIRGDYALVSLVGAETPIGVSLSIDEVARTTTPGISESIVGLSQLQEIAAYAHDPMVAGLARAVAKLSFIQQGLQYVCTGFMVGDNLLMTNEHCVNTQAACATTVAIFDFQRLANGSLNQGTQFRCKRLRAVDFALDVAVLELAQIPGPNFGVLSLSAEPVLAADPLFVVQHPGGRPKMIALVDCLVTEPVAPGRGPATDVAHRCDTEGGSSGSPIFNARGQVACIISAWGRAISGTRTAASACPGSSKPSGRRWAGSRTGRRWTGAPGAR